MLGILIQLMVSWLLLRFIEKQSLEALGIAPSQKRLFQFLAGFGLSFVFVGLQFWIGSMLKHNAFILNPDYKAKDFVIALWYVIKSVCFEELIFRGALLYILIQRTGPVKAIALSAVAFGVYHWFSFGVFGQPVNMIFIFITTSLVGLVYAYSFYKSGSIGLPFALHLGYNFTSMIIFSGNNAIWKQWLINAQATDPAAPSIYLSIGMMVVAYLGYPFLSFLLVRKFVANSSFSGQKFAAK